MCRNTACFSILTIASNHGRNFVVKCGEGQLGVKSDRHRVDAEVTFHIYRFPILFLDVFWEQHWSRFAMSLPVIYILIYLNLLLDTNVISPCIPKTRPCCHQSIYAYKISEKKDSEGKDSERQDSMLFCYNCL